MTSSSRHIKNRIQLMAEDRDESRGARWGRLRSKLLPGRRQASYDDGANGDKPDDLADFFGPSSAPLAENRRPLGPKLDTSVASRWPKVSHVIKAGNQQQSPEDCLPFHYSKPRRRQGLAVHFIDVHPEVIGFGGDDCEQPTIKVAHKRPPKPLQGRQSAETRRERAHFPVKPRREESTGGSQTRKRPSSPIRSGTTRYDAFQQGLRYGGDASERPTLPDMNMSPITMSPETQSPSSPDAERQETLSGFDKTQPYQNMTVITSTHRRTPSDPPKVEISSPRDNLPPKYNTAVSPKPLLTELRAQEGRDFLTANHGQRPGSSGSECSTHSSESDSHIIPRKRVGSGEASRSRTPSPDITKDPSAVRRKRVGSDVLLRSRTPSPYALAIEFASAGDDAGIRQMPQYPIARVHAQQASQTNFDRPIQANTSRTRSPSISIQPTSSKSPSPYRRQTHQSPLPSEIDKSRSPQPNNSHTPEPRPPLRAHTTDSGSFERAQARASPPFDSQSRSSNHPLPTPPRSTPSTSDQASTDRHRSPKRQDSVLKQDSKAKGLRQATGQIEPRQRTQSEKGPSYSDLALQAYETASSAESSRPSSSGQPLPASERRPDTKEAEIFRCAMRSFEMTTLDKTPFASGSTVFSPPWIRLRVLQHTDADAPSIKLLSVTFYDSDSALTDFSIRKQRYHLDIHSPKVLHLLAPPVPSSKHNIRSRESKPDKHLDHASKVIAGQVTLRTVEFSSMSDLHMFLRAITGHVVHYDSASSKNTTIHIPRPRSVLAPGKTYQPSHARIQLLSGRKGTRLHAFLVNTRCVVVELQAWDKFELAETKDVVAAVKIVEARFAQISGDTGGGPEGFINLDCEDYIGEREDLLIGFQEDKDREEFSKELPGEVGKPKGFTLKRRI